MSWEEHPTREPWNNASTVNLDKRYYTPPTPPGPYLWVGGIFLP